MIRSFIRKLVFSRKNYQIGDHSVVYKTANIVSNLKSNEDIKIGEFCHIKGELLLFGHGGRIEMGDYCYVGPNTYIWSAKGIKIGNRVLISHNCSIFDNDTHPLDPGERHRQFKEIITRGHPEEINLKEEEVIIEDDVLISANSIILKGVRIERGAIIGAGSIVTKNVSAFAVVAGNPAITIGKVNCTG